MSVDKKTYSFNNCMSLFLIEKQSVKGVDVDMQTATKCLNKTVLFLDLF